MHGPIRTLLHPPTTLRDFDERQERAQQEKLDAEAAAARAPYNGRSILVSNADHGLGSLRGFLKNEPGAHTLRGNCYVADSTSVVEFEPGTSPHAVFIWSWDSQPDIHTSATVVLIDDFEAFCLQGLQYVADQRARLAAEDAGS